MKCLKQGLHVVLLTYNDNLDFLKEQTNNFPSSHLSYDRFLVLSITYAQMNHKKYSKMVIVVYRL